MSKSPVMFVNTHSDFPIQVTRQRRNDATHVLETEYLPIQRSVNLRMELMTVACDVRIPIFGGILDMGDPRTVLEMIDAMHMEVSELPDHYGLVLTAEDIDRHLDAGRIALMLNLEGIGCIEDDFALWRTYYRQGVRALSLTHDPQNRMASGCREPDGGLSRLGRKFVAELNSYNLVLDLVHAGERSFYDALEHYDGMVVVSHSNAKSVFDCPRNLTDDQIRAVGQRGGFVAPMFCGGFLRPDGENATSDDVVRHIDHLVDLIGIDHVAIGPDWVDYMSDFFPGPHAAEKIQAGSLAWANDLDELSKIQNLSVALEKHGYKSAEVRKIMGENALRSYREILGRHPQTHYGPGARHALQDKLAPAS